MMCDYVPPSHYEQVVESYRDNYGLIVQKDLDGGDSSHRVGLYYYGLYLMYKEDKILLQKIKEDFLKDFNKIKIGPGQFVRHPDPSKWYSNPRNFSRDQTSPLVIAMGAFDQYDDLKANLLNLIKNKGFYPNDLKNWDNAIKIFPEDYNDIASIGDYGSYIRSFKRYELYPFLLLSDITLFGSAVIRVGFSYYDPTDTSDDLNFTLHILQSEDIMPTPLSKMAKWIYSMFKRMVLPPDKGYQSDLAVQASWDYYFREEANGPPLNEVYRCIIKETFYPYK